MQRYDSGERIPAVVLLQVIYMPGIDTIEKGNTRNIRLHVIMKFRHVVSDGIKLCLAILL